MILSVWQINFVIRSVPPSCVPKLSGPSDNGEAMYYMVTETNDWWKGQDGVFRPYQTQLCIYHASGMHTATGGRRACVCYTNYPAYLRSPKCYSNLHLLYDM